MTIKIEKILICKVIHKLSTKKMSYKQKTHWNFKCIKLFYIYFWPGVKNRRRNTIGYLFPGERSACYSADMLLRQYKRVRRELGKKFHYRDIKKVIVFSRVFQRTFMKKSITSAGTAKGWWGCFQKNWKYWIVIQ